MNSFPMFERGDLVYTLATVFIGTTVIPAVCRFGSLGVVPLGADLNLPTTDYLLNIVTNCLKGSDE